MSPALIVSGALLSAAVGVMMLGLVAIAAGLWWARAVCEGRS